MQIPKTYMAKPEDVKRACIVIDAKDKVLGRVAAKAASILRGKHKTMYTPNIDTGDLVVIINADKFRVTGKKMTDKLYVRHTGYQSGKREVPLQDMLRKRPTEAMKLAVTRMIPSGPLGYQIRKRLKVYAGDKHPHEAQKPSILEV